MIGLGKSKRRIIAKAKHDKVQLQISRKEALNIVCQELKKNPASTSAKKIILLFGLRAEELSEIGLTYEILRSLDGLVNDF